MTFGPLANTIDLLVLHGFKYKIVQKHHQKKFLYNLNYKMYVVENMPSFACVSKIIIHKPELTGNFAGEYLQKSEQKVANDSMFQKCKESYFQIKELLIQNQLIRQI